MKTLAIFVLVSMHLVLAGNSCRCRRRKTVPPHPGNEKTCPSELWIQRNDSSCYLYNATNWFYSEAAEFCESQADGVKLVQIDDSAENDFVKLNAENIDPKPSTGYWIGLRNFNGVETWLPDNVNATFFDWFNFPQQPDNRQSCGAIWNSFNWQWADIECTVANGEGDTDGRKLFALCEFDLD